MHTALRAGVRPNDRVLVSGAGSVGLFATLALRELTAAGEIIVVAKHGHQRELALELGATEVVAPDEVLRRVRRSTGAFQLKPEFSSPYLLGGVDVAVDAVGSKQSLETALHATRAGGRVVMSGMPTPADLSAAWFRELEVVGHLRVVRRRVPAEAPPSWSDTTRSAASPSPSPAIPCTAGGRRSTTRTPPVGSAPSRSRSIQGAPNEVHSMSRPGFVLEVDDRTPPLIVHEGLGFRLEDKFPLGTRVVYPPESLPAVPDVEEAIREALLNPVDSEPLPELLFSGMRLTIAFDDLSLPLPTHEGAGHPRPDHRAGPHHGRGGRRRRRRADRRQRAAPPDDRRPS